MLLKDFYTVEGMREQEPQKYVVDIKLNKEHEIFKGHFPDHPVAPGVCMMQIVKELTERIVGKSLFMFKASNIKFMALINPEINAVLKLEIDISSLDESEYKVKNVTYFDETVALKLVSTYSVV